MQDQFSGIDVQEDQLQEVLRHLEDNPVKVSLKQEDGSWSYWMDRAIKAEARRTSLREAENRYRNELLPDEERQLLRDRVLKLKRELKLA